MTAKVGRNDPCPCGSGRKYKQCCGKPEVPPTPAADSHEGAVQRALAWLSQHHRRAMAAAFEEAIDSAAMACFDDDEEAATDAIAQLDGDVWSQLQINLTEWLLAEGDIAVKGDYQRVSELLLGPRGPLLTVGQRAWLAQLAQRPLRLYDVTDVEAGAGVTLCDAVDPEAAPVFVDEREGSRTMRPGMQVAARVMDVGDRHQLSGAVYSFSILDGHEVQRRLRALHDHPSKHAEDNAMMASMTIIDGWLAQYLRGRHREVPGARDRRSQGRAVAHGRARAATGAAARVARGRDAAGSLPDPRRRDPAQLRELGRRAHSRAERQVATTGDRDRGRAGARQGPAAQLRGRRSARGRAAAPRPRLLPVPLGRPGTRARLTPRNGIHRGARPRACAV
jgi:hypothetical protein